MADFLKRLRSLLNGALGVRPEPRVRRTLLHPALGELRFVGSGDLIDGVWEMTPPGFRHRVTVDFPSAPGEPPAPDDLAELARILGDPDALFERFRAAAASEYHWTDEPLPADWRAALRLDHVQLPDREEAEAWWQVAFWCEAARYWLVVTFEGDAVADVGMEG